MEGWGQGQGGGLQINRFERVHVRSHGDPSPHPVDRLTDTPPKTLPCRNPFWAVTNQDTFQCTKMFTRFYYCPPMGLHQKAITEGHFQPEGHNRRFSVTGLLVESGLLLWPSGVHPPTPYTPPPILTSSRGHRSRWYVSYCNAFLFHYH